jgi:dienelactone hydrolase
VTAPSTRTEHVQVGGGEMSAHVALPDSGAGPGIVVLHAIFGVNDYVRDACRRLTELGYCTLVPDLFWRTEPGSRGATARMVWRRGWRRRSVWTPRPRRTTRSRRSGHCAPCRRSPTTALGL